MNNTIKCLFVIVLGCIVPFQLTAQSVKIDTLYYDKDWKIAPTKDFAEYYRIVVTSDNPDIPNKFRDFYITGEKQGEGNFISIDKYDDSKSVFDGELFSYYLNGQKESERTFVNGQIEGKYTIYQNNGLVSKEMEFVNGLLNGLYTEFNEDGSCIRTEYDNGNFANNYYWLISKEGYVSKVNIETNQIFWEQLGLEDLIKEPHNGVNWSYYSQNGLTVATTCSIVKDYGNWYRVDIIFSNNSTAPIEISPEKFQASIINLNGEEEKSKVLTCDEYMKKINRKQVWSAIAMGMAEGMATSNAGYSTTTSNTSSFYNGSSSYRTNGSANSRLLYSGSSYSSTTSTTYNAAAAYQARVLSQQRMNEFSNAQWEAKASRQEGYLKHTIIYPGESVQGFINIPKDKGNTLYFEIPICGVSYLYNWDIGK